MKFFIELFHGLGDTVCALPMLKVVRDNYPNAYIVIAVKGKPQADIIKASNIVVDRLVYWNVYKNSVFDNLKMILKLRSYKFDYGINVVNTPVKKAKLLMKSIGCKKCIGIQHQLGKNFNDLRDKYHFVEANLLAVQPICKPPEVKIYPNLYVNEESLNIIKKKWSILNLGLPIIGVCIGSGDYSLKNKWLRTGKVITKAWGIDNIQNLVEILLNNSFNVVLFGGVQEIDLLKKFNKKILEHQNLLNLVAKTDINGSIAAASLCNLVIGIDTGMQHIAAAVGTKTLSIFGPTSPQMCGAYANNAEFVEVNVDCKYCYGTKMYINCNDRKCLKEVDIKLVIDRIKKQIQ